MKFKLRKPNLDNVLKSDNTFVIASYAISLVSLFLGFLTLSIIVSHWLFLLIPVFAISYTIYNLFKE